MSPTAIDVHGFGGGFTLGAAQAGWNLRAKFSRGIGFGVINALSNHDLLGENWDSIALPPAQWEPMPANLVFGNPPCAAFSTFNTAKGSRGMDSSINDYMWELVRYAGMVRPEIVIFESVQQTFRQGLDLMRKLRVELEAISGLEYQLVHVLHNNAGLGGCSIRRRYFWVAHRLPAFGVEPGVVRRDGSGIDPLTFVPTFGDMLRDLEPLGLTLRPQPYRGTVRTCSGHHPFTDAPLSEDHRCTFRVEHSSDWCRREVHDGSGIVDGHDIEHRPHTHRVLSLLQDEENDRGVPWEEGTELATVMRAYVQKNGGLPSAWHYISRIDDLAEDGSVQYVVDERGKRHRKRREVWKDDYLIEHDYPLGPHQPHRWRADRMARVITGGATNAVYHPRQNRTLTQREAARIQGFPDNWRIWPVREAPDLGAAWGKGVPVQAARWITYWAKRALEGRPGPIGGTPINTHRRFTKVEPAERELVVDVTNTYQPFARAIGDPG